MSRAILICGKICSGKSLYAAELVKRHRAVLLSCDEITLALFGQNTGEKHDEIAERTQKYLFEKSAEILRTGINVVLDWGFWQKRKREEARKFYADKGICSEMHCIEISDADWQQCVARRNEKVLSGEASAYYIDKGLADKFNRIYEPPERGECDVYISNRLEKTFVRDNDTAEIRKMTIADYENVYALWISCAGMGLNDTDDSRDGIERFLERNPETCFVCEKKGEIIGAVIAGNDGRRGYIYHTAVSPEHRRKGVAAALVGSALSALKEKGISKSALLVFAQNETANSFWENCGFTARTDIIYRNKALREITRIDT